MLTNKDGALAVQAEDVEGAVPACIANAKEHCTLARMLLPNGSSTIPTKQPNELIVEQMLPACAIPLCAPLQLPHTAACRCTDTAGDEHQCTQGSSSSSSSSSGLVGQSRGGLVEQLGPVMVSALAAAYAQPERQVVQRPTAAIMVLYFKKHLQRHMASAGVVGTEHMSLVEACSALEKQRTGCTQSAVELVAHAMEDLRQESVRGEKKTQEQLAWELAEELAAQHARERQDELDNSSPSS